jgi:hypothetical protein
MGGGVLVAVYDEEYWSAVRGAAGRAHERVIRG